MTYKRISKQDLEKTTKEFLIRHCIVDSNSDSIDETWSEYNFVGSIPNQDRMGCYALVRGGNVIYIGSGTKLGNGIYEGFGIGSRLSAHVVSWDKTEKTKDKTDRKYKPKEKWKGVSQIYTYGFSKNLGYMAPALEAYLLSKHKPECNVMKTK